MTFLIGAYMKQPNLIGNGLSKDKKKMLVFDSTSYFYINFT